MNATSHYAPEAGTRYDSLGCTLLASLLASVLCGALFL